MSNGVRIVTIPRHNPVNAYTRRALLDAKAVCAASIGGVGVSGGSWEFDDRVARSRAAGNSASSSRAKTRSSRSSWQAVGLKK